MADVRYQLPGVPNSAAAGISAFLPGLTRAAASGAVTYKNDVTGTMGMVAIPASTINTQMDTGPAAIAQQGTRRSSDAPGAWYPQIWYQGRITERPGAGMPIQIYSPVRPGRTTVLPVPTSSLGSGRSLRSKQAMTARRAILQRVRQLPWFPRIQSFPDAMGAGNSRTGDGSGSA